MFERSTDVRLPTKNHGTALVVVAVVAGTVAADLLVDQVAVVVHVGAVQRVLLRRQVG